MVGGAGRAHGLRGAEKFPCSLRRSAAARQLADMQSLPLPSLRATTPPTPSFNLPPQSNMTNPVMFIANPDAYSGACNANISIPAPGLLANDASNGSAPDLAVIWVKAPTAGRVVDWVPSGAFTYQPPANFSGECGGQGGVGTAGRTRAHAQSLRLFRLPSDGSSSGHFHLSAASPCIISPPLPCLGAARQAP